MILNCDFDFWFLSFEFSLLPSEYEYEYNNSHDAQSYHQGIYLQIARLSPTYGLTGSDGRAADIVGSTVHHAGIKPTKSGKKTAQ